MINENKGGDAMTTNAVKMISTKELVEILSSVKGTTFASVIYFTDEKNSVTVNGKPALQKLVQCQVTLNSDYEGKVNRLLERQGDEPSFEAKKMNGFRHLEGFPPCLVASEKTGELALSYICEHGKKPKVYLFHNGKYISRQEAIERGLFRPSAFTPKKTAGRGAVAEENNFQFRNLYLKNILEIKLFGVRYRINPE